MASHDSSISGESSRARETIPGDFLTGSNDVVKTENERSESNYDASVEDSVNKENYQGATSTESSLPATSERTRKSSDSMKMTKLLFAELTSFETFAERISSASIEEAYRDYEYLYKCESDETAGNQLENSQIKQSLEQVSMLKNNESRLLADSKTREPFEERDDGVFHVHTTREQNEEEPRDTSEVDASRTLLSSSNIGDVTLENEKVQVQAKSPVLTDLDNRSSNSEREEAVQEDATPVFLEDLESPELIDDHREGIEVDAKAFLIEDSKSPESFHDHEEAVQVNAKVFLVADSENCELIREQQEGITQEDVKPPLITSLDISGANENGEKVDRVEAEPPSPAVPEKSVPIRKQLEKAFPEDITPPLADTKFHREESIFGLGVSINSQRQVT